MTAINGKSGNDVTSSSSGPSSADEEESKLQVASGSSTVGRWVKLSTQPHLAPHHTPHFAPPSPQPSSLLFGTFRHLSAHQATHQTIHQARQARQATLQLHCYRVVYCGEVQANPRLRARLICSPRGRAISPAVHTPQLHLAFNAGHSGHQPRRGRADDQGSVRLCRPPLRASVKK